MLEYGIATLEQHLTLNEATINAFKAAMRGAVLQPGDTGYDEARRVWNGMIDKYPALIARCTGVADVIASVNFAREHSLLVAVRGGGHNVAGMATCDGGLLIDLSLMKGIHVDAAARSVRAQPGVTIGELDRETQVFGLATPMGVVSETGIAGLTLGGGFGWLRNKYGLACDNVLSMDVVTADGCVLTASAAENSDLFWAVRGGGGNFGIVTSFEYRLHPVGPEVMFVFVFHHGERMAEGLRLYRDFCATAPDEVSTIAFTGLFPDNPHFPAEIIGLPFIAFGAMYVGSVEDGQKVLQPLRDFSQPLLDFSGPMPFTQAQTMFDADYPAGKLRYYWKSLNLMTLTDEVIDRLVDHARRQPSPLSTTDLWYIGGAVKRTNVTNAFNGRHAAFLLNPEANWESPADDAANIQWVRDFIAAMEPYSDGSRYLNFAGLHEEGDQMMRQGFGDHYARLGQIKAKYDPTNLFRLNQNIKPSVAFHPQTV